MRVIYKGDIYSYEPWDDIEPNENCKTFHDVYLIERDVQGEQVGKTRLDDMPMSPYSRPDHTVFRMWIESGMPTKKDMGLNGNARIDDITNYYWKWLDNQIDKQLLGEDDG